MTTIQIRSTSAPKARPPAKAKGSLDDVYEAISQLEEGQWFAVPNTTRAYGPGGVGRSDEFRKVMTTNAAIRRWCNKNGVEGIAIYLADDGRTGLVVKKVSDGVEDDVADADESGDDEAGATEAHDRNRTLQPDPPRPHHTPGKAVKKAR